MFTSPPQKPPTFRVRASDVLPAFEQVIKKSKAINDRVASVTTVNFDTVIKPLALDEAQWSDIGTLSLLQHVSPDKSIRDAATEGQQKLSDYAVEASMREDVYKAVKEVFKSQPALDHEDKRLLTRFELEYRRNGLALPTETQDKVKALQKKMSQISIAFSKNLGEENGGVWFTKAELEGVPEDLVNSWETRATGKETEYKMTFKYPDIIPTTKYAQLEETRHRAWVADGNKVPQNVELMVEMVQLRQQVAALLGYKNFADYVEEVKMSKTSAAVLEFLDDLGQKLRPAGLRDLEELKAIKKSQGQDGPLMAWDHAWTKRLLVEQQYQVDAAKVAEYFEMNATVANMFGIYEALFSLKFVQIAKDDAHQDVWHEDVKQYAVWRSDTEKFVGWLYMDMFPREGKYGHAANFGIIPGFTNEQGKRVYPVTALVCNFSKPSKDKPSLLKHDEVVTFFHELGHGIHDLMGETKYAKFHGTAVARDFVEAPSQMLENWCFSNTILSRVSKHYKTGEPLPVELIEKMKKAKYVSQGLFNLRQLYFGLFDMKLHTDYEGKTAADLTALWNDMRNDISFCNAEPDNPAGEASFAHIMGGYEAGYYGYLWSQVYSSDMFFSKFETHELDPEIGARYRDTVLRPGDSKDAIDLLVEFLGREPNNVAFLRELGLSGSKL